MLKKVLICVAVLVAALIAVVATRPSTYRVERSTQVTAEPRFAYALIADYARWREWSPWEKLDPAMKKQIEGPVGAPGSKYSWQGNDDVGTGSLTILEADAPKLVRHQLAFIEPWAGNATTAFVLAPEAGGTRVTWSMEGNNDFMGKAMCLVMDMDAMIGKDYEAGLAALKTVAEADASDAARADAEIAPPTNPGDQP